MMKTTQKIKKLGLLSLYLVSIAVLLVFGVYALNEAYAMDTSQQSQRYYLFLVSGLGFLGIAAISLCGNFLFLILEKFSPKLRERLRGQS